MNLTLPLAGVTCFGLGVALLAADWTDSAERLVRQEYTSVEPLSPAPDAGFSANIADRQHGLSIEFAHGSNVLTFASN